MLHKYRLQLYWISGHCSQQKCFDADYCFVLGSYCISSVLIIRTGLQFYILFNVFFCSLSGFYFRASRWWWVATWILHSHLFIDRQIWGKLCAWRKEWPRQVLLFWWKVNTDYLIFFCILPPACSDTKLIYIDCMLMSFLISFLIKNCSWKVFSTAAVAIPLCAWGLCK